MVAFPDSQLSVEHETGGSFFGSPSSDEVIAYALPQAGSPGSTARCGTGASWMGTISFANDTSNPLDSSFGFSNAALGVFSTYSHLSRWREGAYRAVHHEGRCTKCEEQMWQR